MAHTDRVATAKRQLARVALAVDDQTISAPVARNAVRRLVLRADHLLQTARTWDEFRSARELLSGARTLLRVYFHDYVTLPHREFVPRPRTRLEDETARVVLNARRESLGIQEPCGVPCFFADPVYGLEIDIEDADDESSRFRYGAVPARVIDYTDTAFRAKRRRGFVRDDIERHFGGDGPIAGDGGFPTVEHEDIDVDYASIMKTASVDTKSIRGWVISGRDIIDDVHQPGPVSKWVSR